MTNKIRLIIEGIAAIILITGTTTICYFAFRCTTDGQVVIKKVYVQGPTVYKSNPKKDGGDLKIDGKMNGNKFHATCEDKYKSTYRDFDMGIITKPKNYHVIQLGYGPLYDIDTKQFRHSVDAMYFYSWPNVALGAGIFGVFDKTQLYDIGPRVALQGRFEAK